MRIDNRYLHLSSETINGNGVEKTMKAMYSIIGVSCSSIFLIMFAVAGEKNKYTCII